MEVAPPKFIYSKYFRAKPVWHLSKDAPDVLKRRFEEHYNSIEGFEDYSWDEFLEEEKEAHEEFLYRTWDGQEIEWPHKERFPEYVKKPTVPVGGR